MAESLARVPIVIRVHGVGEARGELNRLTAPLTVGEILKRLPLQGITIPTVGCVSVMTVIRRGTEKPVTQAEAGTLTYWPQQGSICIYPTASKTQGLVNRIGSVQSNLKLFKDLKAGSRIVIEKV